ncbi:polysulfide reductase NrfD [Litorilinea aerophila]|uniref:Polysulfide reductase n=1 Tax=Litorilinea aerophila TaxID=1204385 RepID=A0A540VE66_9CHLR|nr:NrfD/PsrC family molybdoenzyme membrane anchor subunit [Litorilinea aerophila]MCC9077204.1 polysulfide reductase NrfD [Litorilinea aerophila]OUC06005.1 polysulfide reductase [Litorilinea aerophila]GIV78928.1 MAG: Hdr menaquinol oxidoreductase integral membrane subunit [Litorilinea sp.]
MRTVGAFFRDALDNVTAGSLGYHLWMGFLTFLMLLGAYAYSVQLREGLIVTGMYDYVSWGLYISNFTFLVGVAAAALMLVLPTYVFQDTDFVRAVLFGEGMAVAALIMCLAFVVVDMGGPARLWHMIPIIGIFNWPRSMLTWDVIVLNVYLVINLTVPFYILYHHYQGRKPNPRVYLPGVVLSLFWAVGIHLVTAFLYAGLPARPFWNSSLLGPRFLASAFAAGPALMILILTVINRTTPYTITASTIQKLSLVVTGAAQVNLIMLVSEMFKEFYWPTEHSKSAIYLFFGLDGHSALVPWMWTSLGLTAVATAVLTVPALRRRRPVLLACSALLFVGIWIEKGMGLIVPGFVPEPWGRIFVEYSPTWVEWTVTLGIWALGAWVFTLLTKVAVGVELRYQQSH